MSLPSFMPSQYGFDSGVIGCGMGRSVSMRLLSPPSVSSCLQRPAEPCGNAATHHPGCIDVGEEIAFLSEEGGCLTIRAAQPGQISPPKGTVRSMRLDHTADVRVQAWIEICFSDVALIVRQ